MSFLPTTPIYLAYLAACLLLALTPGPDMALFMQKTLSGGRAHGLAALGGAMAGVLVHTFAAALGLSALIAASSRLYGGLKIVGALYLLWLAISALRHGSALKLASGAAVETTLGRSFLTGALINLTNPKIILFFVTFLPQFIEAGDADATPKFFALGATFVCVGSLVNAALIVVASRFVASVRAHPKAMRGFDYAVAALMSGFAARLLIAADR